VLVVGLESQSGERGWNLVYRGQSIAPPGGLNNVLMRRLAIKKRSTDDSEERNEAFDRKMRCKKCENGAANVRNATPAFMPEAFSTSLFIHREDSELSQWKPVATNLRNLLLLLQAIASFLQMLKVESWKSIRTSCNATS
jgi:hypothetical protein